MRDFAGTKKNNKQKPVNASSNRRVNRVGVSRQVVVFLFFNSWPAAESGFERRVDSSSEQELHASTRKAGHSRQVAVSGVTRFARSDRAKWLCEESEEVGMITI